MKIIIPTADLLKNRPLPPEWYRAKFVKFEGRPSNDKKSTNFVATFILETDSREMEALWNSKALGMMEKFITVIKGTEPEIDPTTGNPKPLDFEPEEFFGKFVMVKLENDQFDGRLISKIKDFLPDGADTNLGQFTP